MREFTLVITDDDIENYEILMYAFCKINVQHEFKYLQDGVLLLQYLCSLIETKQKLPDIIILDYNMPKMDGLEVLEKIKACEYLKKIPVIIFSTSDCPEQQKRAFLLGADGCVTKSGSLKKITDFAANIHAFLLGAQTIPGKLQH